MLRSVVVEGHHHGDPPECAVLQRVIPSGGQLLRAEAVFTSPLVGRILFQQVEYSGGELSDSWITLSGFVYANGQMVRFQEVKWNEPFPYLFFFITISWRGSLSNLSTKSTQRKARQGWSLLDSGAIRWRKGFETYVPQLLREVRVVFPLKVLNSKAGACHNSRKDAHCLVALNLKFHARCNHQTNKPLFIRCLFVWWLHLDLAWNLKLRATKQRVFFAIVITTTFPRLPGI